MLEGKYLGNNQMAGTITLNRTVKDLGLDDGHRIRSNMTTGPCQLRGIGEIRPSARATIAGVKPPLHSLKQITTSSASMRVGRRRVQVDLVGRRYL
jgi:hypothetical protein